MDRFVTRINPSISSSSQQAETSSLVQLPQVNVTESSRCETGNTLQAERNKLPLDLDLEKPSQPTLNFPKTKTGSKYRSFQKNWYNGRNWLEYSVSRDKAFCFACRKFGQTSNAGGLGSDMVFIEGRFNKWKVALEKDKGLLKHETSKTHLNAMNAWLEAQKRQQTGMSFKL